MPDNAYMQYEHESGTVARWHGGEYIELGYFDDGRDGEFLGAFVAVDVINVWDHASDAPRIPRSIGAFRKRVDERLAEELAAE